MRKRTSNKTLLIGGVAALVILGAGGLYLAMGRSDPPAAEGAAAEGEASHAEEEGGHAEGEAEAPEGFVALSAAQAQAANLVVVGVGRGGDASTSCRATTPWSARLLLR